jgi:lipopolysaccharide export system protein LptC
MERGTTREGAATRARPPRERAYAEARRHSTRVRFLRRAIPVGTALAIGGLLMVTFAEPLNRVAGLTLGPVSLSGTKITMENPRLSGFRKDSRPYEVTAVAAMQDVRKPSVVELKEMKARMVMDDRGGAAHLEAAAGIFDTSKEQLELRQDIRVKTEGGQTAQLKSASIDFKAGTVLSREPVTVTFPNGIIEAQGLEVSDNGKVIVFTGRVHTTLEDTSEPTVTASTPAPAAEQLVQPAEMPVQTPAKVPAKVPVQVPAKMPAQVLSFETQPASLRP